MKSRLCAALLLAAVLPVVAACGRGSQEKAESQQPPDNVAKPKWADLFFPPNGYVYFNGPQLKPSDPPEQKAHWLVDAAILAYGCHRDENAGPTCQFYSDAELQSQFVRGGFTDFQTFGDWRDEHGFVTAEHKGGTQAFFAKRDDWAILSFRGTEKGDPSDLPTDLDIDPVRWNNGAMLTGPRVHRGFKSGLERIWPEVSAAVAKFRQDHPTAEVSITGHSLGGALANVAAASLASDPNLSLYTFGCPFTGNPEFNQIVRTNVKDHWYRYVDGNDLVAHVPPGVPPLLPYVQYPPARHVGTRELQDSISGTLLTLSRALGHDLQLTSFTAIQKTVEDSLQWFKPGNVPPSSQEIPGNLADLADHCPSRYLYYVWHQ